VDQLEHAGARDDAPPEALRCCSSPQ